MPSKSRLAETGTSQTGTPSGLLDSPGLNVLVAGSQCPHPVLGVIAIAVMFDFSFRKPVVLSTATAMHLWLSSRIVKLVSPADNLKSRDSVHYIGTPGNSLSAAEYPQKVRGS
jgi:hypothetical protein